jgi:hypothetical protein
VDESWLNTDDNKQVENNDLQENTETIETKDDIELEETNENQGDIFEWDNIPWINNEDEEEIKPIEPLDGGSGFEASPEVDVLDNINLEENNLEEEKEDIEIVDDKEELEPIVELSTEDNEDENIEDKDVDKNIEQKSVMNEDDEENIDDDIDDEDVENKDEDVEYKQQDNDMKENEEKENEDIEEEEIEDEDIDLEIEEEKEEWTQRETNVEIDDDKSDLQKKFYELIRETKNVHELVNKDLSEWFDLLWWNDDRKKIIYKIFVWDNFVNIDRIETLKDDESEETNTLSFVLKDTSLKVNVDDELLYDEVEDLLENPGKKMQVSEKLNKFIFLVTEEYKKIENQKKEKEKRNEIKWIFRNF